MENVDIAYKYLEGQYLIFLIINMRNEVCICKQFPNSKPNSNHLNIMF